MNEQDYFRQMSGETNEIEQENLVVDRQHLALTGEIKYYALVHCASCRCTFDHYQQGVQLLNGLWICDKCSMEQIADDH